MSKSIFPLIKLKNMPIQPANMNISKALLLQLSAVAYLMSLNVDAACDGTYPILSQDYFMFGSEKAFDGRCRIELLEDGSLVTKRDGQITWSTGPSPYGEIVSYFAHLKYDGRLVIGVDGDAGDDEFYSTVKSDVPYVYDDPQFTLDFDSDCFLQINAKSTEGEDKRTMVWSNMRSHLITGDVMGRGDILQGSFHMYSDTKDYGADIKSFILLQNDCNLVQFVGNDLSDRGDVVWSPGISRGEGAECFVYIAPNFIGAYEGKFLNDGRIPDRSNLYWERKIDDGAWLGSDEGFHAD